MYYIYIFYLDSSLSLLQFPISAMPLSKIKQFFFSFSSYFGNAIVTNQLQQIFFPLLFRQCHHHKFIPQNFFPFILAMPLPQINCHFFFFFFEKWYVHTIFTTNSKWKVVTSCYCWIKKVISVLNSNLN